MKPNSLVTPLTVIFVLFGLIFLANISPSQNILPNAAVVGFATASPEDNLGLIASMNAFLTSNKISPETREKYLPIYILLNMLFIVSVIMVFDKKVKKR